MSNLFRLKSPRGHWAILCSRGLTLVSTLQRGFMTFFRLPSEDPRKAFGIRLVLFEVYALTSNSTDQSRPVSERTSTSLTPNQCAAAAAGAATTVFPVVKTLGTAPVPLIIFRKPYALVTVVIGA